MDRTKVLKQVIQTIADYYKNQNSFRKIFQNEPVMSKSIEVFDANMDAMIDSVLDILGVKDDKHEDKYIVANWKRDTCKTLIKDAAENKKYVEPAIEIIADWENLDDYTAKVENKTWFYSKELLDEHITGYKKWHQEQRKKENTKTA